MKTLLAAAAAMTFGAAAVTFGTAAQAADIQAFDQGWYKPDVHYPHIVNTVTGFTDNLYRSFYAFDLTGVTAPATAVSITFYGGNGYYSSDDPSERVGLFDYTGAIDDLLLGVGDIAATWADLGGGVQIGEGVVSSPRGPMPQFTITLSSAFVSQFNAAAASSDKRIALGAVLLDYGGAAQALWASSGDYGPAAYLTYETATVPEPATWALLIGGFGLTGTALRRRAAVART